MIPVHSQLKPARVHEESGIKTPPLLKLMYHMMSGDPLHKALRRRENIPVLIPIHIFPSFANTRSWRKAFILPQWRNAGVARAVAEEQKWSSCTKSNLSLRVYIHRKLRSARAQWGTAVGLLVESSACQGHGSVPKLNRPLPKQTGTSQQYGAETGPCPVCASRACDRGEARGKCRNRGCNTTLPCNQD